MRRRFRMAVTRPPSESSPHYKGWLRLGVAALVGVIAVTACGGSSPPSSSNKKYVLGISNTFVGNGDREEIICSIKVEAAASGKVSKVILNEANTDAAGQISQVNTLVQAGANAIILDPGDPNALTNVISQATSKGVVVVSIDQQISSPDAYQAFNDQEQYGYIGMKWLADKLGGHGNVVELRGIAGAPADTDRHAGVVRALAQYPGIQVVKSVFTGWAYPDAGNMMLTILNSGIKVDGVWTSGTDYTVVNAFTTAGKPYVPIVGTDGNEFIHQLMTLGSKGLTGAAVTNPLVVGAVGLGIALQKLGGGNPSKITKLVPQVISSDQTDMLQKMYEPGVFPEHGDVVSYPPYTHFTAGQLNACHGP